MKKGLQSVQHFVDFATLEWKIEVLVTVSGIFGHWEENWRYTGIQKLISAGKTDEICTPLTAFKW